MAALHFHFVCDAPGGDQFTVVGLKGYEGLSKLYRYEIELKAPIDADIDLDDLLDYTAHLSVEDGSAHRKRINGMLAEFHENRATDNHMHYTAVLVPRLWNLSTYRTNEIYTSERTADEIVRRVLTNAHYQEGTDFDFVGFGGTFIDRDYVCQFRESDFDFIARLMENEGIYFYFEQLENSEKLIISNEASYPALDVSEATYESSAADSERIFAWACRKQRLPFDVTVRDYNPSQPSLDVAGRYDIDASGVGTEYLYGENFSSSQEADQLATIRAEQFSAGKTRFVGESSIVGFHPGYTFQLANHPKQAYNGEHYLLTEVMHEASGLDDTGSGSPEYQNSFTAINAGVQYRPPLVTPKPRFHGTMTAFVYAEAATGMAEVDEQGRYRVHLPFDRADGTRDATDPDRKASAWIRMAQPYVGETEGMYFPLRGGTEVLLTFINGDPDRPIISGAVPNASTPALLTSERPSESIIRTAGNNKIRMEDEPGSERIMMETPSAESWIRIGAPNDPDPVEDLDKTANGIRIQTAGHFWLEAENLYGEYFFGKPHKTHASNPGGGGPGREINAPEQIQRMLGYFGATSGEAIYNPKGLRDYTTNKDGYVAGSAYNSYTVGTQIANAHVRVARCDTFNTQEGNIYDFGGYWNYNLGNSYTENFIVQGQNAVLNSSSLEQDAASLGGPKHDITTKKIKGVIVGSDGKATEESELKLSAGNTWTEKTIYGNAYEYTKGKRTLTIEYETQNEEQTYGKTSYSYQVKCKDREYRYSPDSEEKVFAPKPGEGMEHTYLEDGEGYVPSAGYDLDDYHCIYHAKSKGGISEETRWCRRTHNLLSYTTATQNVANCTDSFSLSLSNSASAAINCATSASFSADAAATTSLSLKAAASVDISISTAFAFKCDISLLSMEINKGGDWFFNTPGTSIKMEGPKPKIVNSASAFRSEIGTWGTEVLTSAAKVLQDYAAVQVHMFPGVMMMG